MNNPDFETFDSNTEFSNDEDSVSPEIADVDPHFDKTQLSPANPELGNLPKTIRGDTKVGNDSKPLKAPEYRDGDVITERYEIREQLGQGGFGAVYSAWDRSLKRFVAIKQSTGLKSFVAGRVRDEARAVASLNHPNIVQIHDLIQVNPVEILIVMERLEGVSLSNRLRHSQLQITDAVRIAVEIAAALVHAHEKQLVHSDLKPGNLFVCKNGSIKLLDFGLAVAYFPDDNNNQIGGTPGYMSPEQIRGESHLIDGRSDLWAFGVVLYEMLTGSRPFKASNAALTNRRTLIKSVPPPRQLNPDIDDELQRIVLKCLKPLIRERYESASDLRNDLVCWLDSVGETDGVTNARSLALESPMTLASSESTALVKRGLQAFTELDASSYLSLIPGGRDRNGVPDSIRFWKRWAQSDDPQTDFPVGVLYGPSGAGKTSYIRAGLFRQLDSDTCSVYVECRPGDLGGRLTRIIESRIHEDSSGSSLRDLLYRLRSSNSSTYGYKRWLIVLDQFESWAHNASLDERLDFAEALRQCDGIQVRVLVVTRDDYWMAVKELFHWLELPMQEGRNVASVELLDAAHAERILEATGRAVGTLPADDEPLSDAQQQFITQAVKELSVNGSVICVHLVMFAQMVRLQHWTPRALRDSGGVSGACSLYLQELFEPSGHQSPEYRRIAPAVNLLLAKVVPPVGQTVSEVVTGHREFADALVESGHSHLLNDSLRILCEELRIITIVSSDIPEQESKRDQGTKPNQANEASECDLYRLSHDFLVEPVNAFLGRMQSRTWRGRTKSRLSELSDIYARRQLHSHLPGILEYVSLLPGSLLQRRTAVESRFLRDATKLHSGRISVALLTFVALIAMSAIAWTQWQSAKEASARELTANIDMLFNGPADDLPERIESLRKSGESSSEVVSAWSDSVDPNVKLRSEVYLQSVAPTSFSELAGLLDRAPDEFFAPILAIAKKTPDVKSVLTALVSTADVRPEDDKTLAEDFSDRQSVRANRAVILLGYLGEHALLLDRMQGTTNAYRDQAFLTQASQWRGSPDLWTELTKPSFDDEVRYHASVLLGSYPYSDLVAANSKVDFAAMINEPSAIIHSSGRYLANHFRQDVTAISLAPPPNAQWQIGPDNMPMVRMKAQNLEYQQCPAASISSPPIIIKIEVDRPYWASTIPVSKRLYAQFVESSEKLPDGGDLQVSVERFTLPEHLLSDPDEPILGTSLSQAYSFCNWLSQREGLQECYQPKTVEPKERSRQTQTFQPIPWSFDEQANGFRTLRADEFRQVTRGNYVKGPFTELAIQVARQGRSYQDKLVFAHPLHSFIPSRTGHFTNDRYCGSWICDSDYHTNLSTEPIWIRPGYSIENRSPILGIFIARNADADSE